ncbi:ribbon-helix-helix domain-containing protein [Clostridium sp. Marseille-Q2269]|uniref:ribbon-helix-helix domain-containing protein n=1 Tax=Clostridium sp. Marseille-Q2269 TaxID=2942205 RepID=UPI002074108E|nr:ribbon-helix-helix domain-containing protein [Clostridium sp. Marseille-Q2269]
MDKKNNDLKTRQRYTASYDKELLEALKHLSKETKIPLSKLLDEAIILLQEKYGRR